MSFPPTASQTVGPYFRIGLSHLNRTALCTEAVHGEHITISGQVFDGAGAPVPDAQLEVWQPDDQGRFAGIDPTEQGSPSVGFTGFARLPTDENGGFGFRTILPGCTTTLDGTEQAPHIVLLLSMRGLLKHLITRIYFAGDARNETDPVLLAVPAGRRQTLYAQPLPGETGHYLWNVRLQGEDETVFFQY